MSARHSGLSQGIVCIDIDWRSLPPGQPNGCVKSELCYTVKRNLFLLGSAAVITVWISRWIWLWISIFLTYLHPSALIVGPEVQLRQSHGTFCENEKLAKPFMLGQGLQVSEKC